MCMCFCCRKLEITIDYSKKLGISRKHYKTGEISPTYSKSKTLPLMPEHSVKKSEYSQTLNKKTESANTQMNKTEYSNSQMNKTEYSNTQMTKPDNCMSQMDKPRYSDKAMTSPRHKHVHCDCANSTISFRKIECDAFLLSQLNFHKI